MDDVPSFENERLLLYYKQIQELVLHDNRLGGRYRLAGENVRRYAERLREEMEQRRLQFSPIIWPD